ncbi:unnamed protein product, partial [Meganyctiphanes norvegica]
ESTAELAVQSGRVGSMQETLDQVRENLDTLLARLLEDVAHQRNTLLTTAVFSDSILDKTDPTISITEGGPPQLCFPTPPIKLRGSPNSTQNRLNKFLPLSLTPGPGGGRQVDTKRVAGVPVTPIHSSRQMIRAARRSPKANVQYSATTHTNTAVDVSVHETSIQCEAEAGLTLELLTVDCRAQHQKTKQDDLRKLKQPNTFRKDFKASRPTATDSKRTGKENQSILKSEKNVHNKPPNTNRDAILQNKNNRNILSASENKNRSQEIERSKSEQEVTFKSAVHLQESLSSVKEKEDSGHGDSIGEETVIGGNADGHHNSKRDSG